MKLPELKIPDSMKNMEPSSAPKIEDIQKVDFAEMKNQVRNLILKIRFWQLQVHRGLKFQRKNL